MTDLLSAVFYDVINFFYFVLSLFRVFVTNFFVVNYCNISTDFRQKTTKDDEKPTKYVAFRYLKIYGI